MFLLILLCLLWLLSGTVIGLLATVAGIGVDVDVGVGVDTIHRSLQRGGWMGILGALTAFGGGWLGVWLVGRPFATAMALWIAIVCVLLVPRLHRVLTPLM